MQLAGIFLISATTLAFQIALTRIFSISQWYHQAFMAISLTLLGYGASGTFLSLFNSILKIPDRVLLSIIASIFSWSLFFSYITLNHIPFDSFRIAWEGIQVWYLVLQYLALTSTFFFSGLCIGCIITKNPGWINRIYAFNLIGSASGVLLFTILVPFFGTPRTIIAITILSFVSVFFFSEKSRKFIVVTSSGIIFMGLFLLYDFEFVNIILSPYKNLYQLLRIPDSRVLFTGENTFSRIDVVKSSTIRYAPGLSIYYAKSPPPQLGITIDGDNITGFSKITATNLLKPEDDFTYFLPSALPFHVNTLQKVLIVNPGSGLDVLTAIIHKANEIHVTEMNPLVIDAIKNKFAAESGNIYSHPAVKIHNTSGRSFARNIENKKFDLITITLKDGYKPVASGTYGLGEDYTYTVEAFQDYFHALSENGIINISRWFQIPPSESLKILGAIINASNRMNISDIKNYILAIRSWSTTNILLKKSPFTRDEILKARDFNKRLGFDFIFHPWISPDEVNIFNRLSDDIHYKTFRRMLTENNLGKFYDSYPFDITPATDNKPFFFQFFKFGQIPEILSKIGKTWQPFGGMGYLVILILLIIAVLLSFILIILPLLFKKHIGTPSRPFILAYFFLLGVGFLLFEIPLIQQSILLLNVPTYSLSITLISLLLFSGVGSFVSGKLIQESYKLVYILIFVLGAIIFILSYLILPVFHYCLGFNLTSRIIINIILLAPPGILMGIPFPAGIRILEKESPGLIPWAWAINGSSSVVSSILATLIAINSGFSIVLMISGLSYISAGGVLFLFLSSTGHGNKSHSPLVK